MAQENKNDEKTRRELLKEVLRRARNEEKQEHSEIVNRQIAIADRMEAIRLEIDALAERDRNNKAPKRIGNTYHAPNKTHEEIMGMSSGELHEWCEQIKRDSSEYNAESRRWDEDFEQWIAKKTVFQRERNKLIDEFIDIKNEFHSLENKEKWLLLSIALRSQPNLLKFFERSDKNL